MIPTESEIKQYSLSKNDTEHFFELIDIKETDFELVYGFEKDNPHVFVKFNKEFSAQHVSLIMKVAVTQIQARIRRQKEWDRLKNPITKETNGCVEK